MKIKYFVLIIIVFCLVACNNSDEDNKSYEAYAPSSGNFMSVFIMNPVELQLEFGYNHESTICMWIWYNTSGSVAYCSSTAARLELYNKYADYYGDTAYYSMHIIGDQHACVAPLSKIEVTSDRDYDEAHPAGTILNDLFLLRYPRYYQYIKSGYKPRQGLNSYALDTVSELTVFKDEPLFSDETHLIFKKYPDTPGKYTFTVAFTFGEDPLTGEKVELSPASIEIEF